MFCPCYNEGTKRKGDRTMKNALMNTLIGYRSEQFAKGKMVDTLSLVYQILKAYDEDKPIDEEQIRAIVDRFFED